VRAFTTIFDKNYLYQGVALYNSLNRHADEFVLYTLCMDEIAYEMMMKMKSSNLVPISIAELITPEVSVVRQNTTHGQFCWVCQPLICEFLLDNFDHDMVTYLEADSLFFSNPEILFSELGGGSVSLVPHNYSPAFDQTATSGKFCVQFNAFKRNNEARKILEYWRQACFKYNKNNLSFAPGQLCLDEWPERFKGAKVIQHPGAGVAPWNIQRYRFDIINAVPHVDGVPVVFYHYHQYGRYENGSHELGHYPLSTQVINFFYRVYVNEIAAAERMVKSIDETFDYRKIYKYPITFMDVLKLPTWQNVYNYLRICKRRILGRHNVISDKYFQ
jgi:hypothetical protein